MRGDFRSKGETVTPDVPQSLPASPDGQPAGSAWRAAGGPRPPARGPGDGQPLLAALLRGGPGQDEQRLRDAGGVAQPSRIARLAGHRVHRGWDVKAFQKQIVMSATYRQGSRWTRPARARPREPPAGAGLGSASTPRRSATMRLAVSGLLNPVGRAEPLPVPAPGLWEELAFGSDFTSQTYDQQGRRPLPPRPLHVLEALAADPSLTVFDAPNRELCTVQRPRTNTPLRPWSCSTTRSTSRPPGSWRSGR